MHGELISTHIKATENTTLAKLRPIDQLRMLIANFSNNDAAELKANEALSKSSLKMRASLQKILTGATERLEDGQHESVVMQISSKYLPYLDDVINDRTGLGRYYNFETRNTDLSPIITYMFILKISRKNG